MTKKSFLDKCKKAFNSKDLVLLNGLYPFNPKIARKSFHITEEQMFVCDLILEENMPFVIEHKIECQWANHYYCDILVKTPFHLIDFEIDGRHHLTNKARRKSDLRKARVLLKDYEIWTVRILNERIRNFSQNPKVVNDALQFLTTKLFSKFNKHIKIAKEIGIINRRIADVK